jgi:hypothetical protein
MRRRDGAARGATRNRIGDFAGGEPGPIPGRGAAEPPRRSVNAMLGVPVHPNAAKPDMGVWLLLCFQVVLERFQLAVDPSVPRQDCEEA